MLALSYGATVADDARRYTVHSPLTPPPYLVRVRGFCKLKGLHE